MKTAVRGAFWIFVYLAVAIAPLVFAWSGPEPGRGLLINLSVALGFVGLAMMGLQFALVARFKTVSAPFGMDVVLLCGPDAMMNAAEGALAHLGVLPERVHSEWFGMV